MAGYEQAQNYFINGKEQIVELLKALNSDEKGRILKHISMKNPQLATELQEKSITIKNLRSLNQHEVLILTNNVNAQILGLALKLAPVELQQNFLRLAPRDYAEEAYKSLVSSVNNEREVARRAMEKVKQVLTSIAKNSRF